MNIHIFKNIILQIIDIVVFIIRFLFRNLVLVLNGFVVACLQQLCLGRSMLDVQQRSAGLIHWVALGDPEAFKLQPLESQC